MTEELPSELEYVSDYQAQENFRVSFRKQLDRCLLLMIKEPTGAFELALAGLDTILDYYKDGIYLDEIEEIVKRYEGEKERLKIEQRKERNKDFSYSKENLRFNFNKERFRALMRLAGRSSFLPFPPVAVTVGGVNPDSDNNFESDKVVSSDDIEDVSIRADKVSQELLDLANAAVSNFSSQNVDSEVNKNDSSV